MLFFLILRNHNHTAYSYFSKLTWDCSVGVYGWELGIYLLLLVTSLVAQMVKHLPTMWETWVQSLGQEDLLEKGMATHSSILASPAPQKRGSKKYLGFPGGSDGKESACNAGDLDSIPGSGRSPGEGNSHPLQ